MPNQLDFLELVLGASLPVQAVMLILLAASIFSWVVIFRKLTVFRQARAEAGRFEERFWSGAELTHLANEVGESRRGSQGIAAVFESGYREYSRLRQRLRKDPRPLLEGADRSMRVTVRRETARLERDLNFLATVGSVSPYIGLFGTVWGIMVSFQALANVKQATIAMVAPGISEALIATAMGLFAAIPAVIAYNRFYAEIERMELRMQSFAEEFSGVLQRQAYLED